jgi:hypothetical protein
MWLLSCRILTGLLFGRCEADECGVALDKREGRCSTLFSCIVFGFEVCGRSHGSCESSRDWLEMLFVSFDV